MKPCNLRFHFRRVLLLTLAASLLAWPSAPLGAVELEWGVGPAAAPRISVRALGSAMNALQAGEAWRVGYSARTGLVSSLSGGASPAFPGSPREAAGAFLAEAAPILGIASVDADLAVSREASSGGSTVLRYDQVHNGAAVTGAQVVVTVDGAGRVTALASSCVPEVTTVNAARLTAPEAVAAAVAAVEAAYGAGAVEGEPVSELTLRPEGDGYRYVWIVEAATRSPMTNQRAYVDAETGELLSLFDANLNLTTGRGKVYKSDAATIRKNVSKEKLRNLYTAGEGNAGYNLAGLYSVTYDDKGFNVSSPTFRFLYKPGTGDKFDQVQTYYQVDGAARWYGSRFGFSHPSQVQLWNFANVLMGGCNAYYSSNIGGFGRPGIAVGDDLECGLDLSRSPDVLYHEYTHGTVDWSVGLSGQKNHYARSLGEALADYFAAARFRNPRIGEAWQKGGLRSMKNRYRYPQDMGYPGYTLPGPVYVPEEHHTSQLMAGFLWDVRMALKKKSGDRFGPPDQLIFTALHSYLVDNGVSRYAGEIDFFDFLTALANAATGSQFYDIYGYAASRGIISYDTFSGQNWDGYTLTPWNDSFSFFYWNVSPATAKTLAFNAKLLQSGDRNDFYFRQDTGANMNVRIEATRRGKSSSFKPAFELRNLAGDALLGTGSTPTAKKAVLTMAVPSGTYLRVAVTGRGGTKGNYRLKIINLDHP